MKLYKFETKKDYRKLIRTIFEYAVFAIVIILLLRLFFVKKTYIPYSEDTTASMGNDNGFICVSYFGIDRTGTETLTSTKRLKEHLSVLKKLGYVTITQQDILDYYNEGKQLPEKSLFLIFEDGRTDTAIFSEPIIEALNYKATICSYAEKFNANDSKFLTGKDLKKMEETSFIENGTNGYRLSYINAFDRYDRFLGQLNSWEFIEINQYLGRNYNHYLMDYIRDKNEIPVESYEQMKERISYDYQLMDEMYTENLGYVPKMYIIMHSNTDRFGNNQRVSDVNEECLKSLFEMNINREGFAVNDSDVNIYDLTRLQSQAYWYTNHLLMRIKDDLSSEQKDFIEFEKGDENRFNKWELLKGAAEFKDNQIIVTSEPKSSGIIKLKNSDSYKNISISTTLKGNLYGIQKLNLIPDEDDTKGVGISVEDKMLKVSDGGKTVSEVNIDEILNVSYPSVEEDDRNALAAEYRARAEYAGSVRESNAYKNESNEVRKNVVRSVQDGAEPYIKPTELNDSGEYSLKAVLYKNTLYVYVEDILALKVLVNFSGVGEVILESVWPENEYSQRNIADDVYDAVFENLCISECDSSGNELQIIYDDRLEGLEKIKYYSSKYFNIVIDWFVENL